MNGKTATKQLHVVACMHVCITPQVTKWQQAASNLYSLPVAAEVAFDMFFINMTSGLKIVTMSQPSNGFLLRGCKT